MATRYFDTSAAVKHYRLEIGTAKVDAFLAEAGSVALISTLGLVEIDSVLARLVRIGQITPAEFQMARGRVSADVNVGVWQTVPLTHVDLPEAQRLLVQHGMTHKIRTLDAIQLAVAVGWRQTHALDEFISADVGLCQLANLEGFSVINLDIP